MADTYILKLGGSIVTDKKSGRPIFRTRRVKEIAREIAKLRSKKNFQLILLYGAGSFGHPLAHRYKLANKTLSKQTLAGMGRTVSAVRELGVHLSTVFLDAGIPVVPLQTSSFVHMRGGRIHFTDLSILETILKNDGAALLGGDVVFSDATRTAIASADVLAVELARKFKRSRLFFATDTDGVHKTFPARRGERPIATLDRAELKDLLNEQRTKIKTTRTDTTGAMLGKLRALLDARGTTVRIFNGNTRGAFTDVLSGKKPGKKNGTSIKL